VGGAVGEKAQQLGWDAEWMRDGVRGSTRDNALARAVEEDAEAEVEVRDGRLVLAAEGASVLPIPFGQIAAVTEPEPFTVRLTLPAGTSSNSAGSG
jgi:hypothetical protein